MQHLFHQGVTLANCRWNGPTVQSSRILEPIRAVNKIRGWGGGWLSVGMSQGTCPRLAVTVWPWMHWMRACPDLSWTCGHLPVDGWMDGWMGYL